MAENVNCDIKYKTSNNFRCALFVESGFVKIIIQFCVALDLPWCNLSAFNTTQINAQITIDNLQLLKIA